VFAIRKKGRMGKLEMASSKATYVVKNIFTIFGGPVTGEFKSTEEQNSVEKRQARRRN